MKVHFSATSGSKYSSWGWKGDLHHVNMGEGSFPPFTYTLKSMFMNKSCHQSV